MTSEFGIDLSSLDDVDDTREVTGVELVAQDCVWRLKTPRGMGILGADAPDYGLDLLEALGSVELDADAASLPERIRAELSKDDRLLEETIVATVTRTVNGPAVAWDIRIRAETAEGPFELVGTSDGVDLNLGVRLLEGGV